MDPHEVDERFARIADRIELETTGQKIVNVAGSLAIGVMLLCVLIATWLAVLAGIKFFGSYLLA